MIYDRYANMSYEGNDFVLWCGAGKGGIINDTDNSLASAYFCGVQQGVDAVKVYHISSGVKSANLPSLFGLKFIFIFLLFLTVQIVSADIIFPTSISLSLHPPGLICIL